MSEDRVPQTVAWIYAALFAVVVALGHVPQFQDANGLTFGLFHLNLYQDLLHGLSGVWAVAAALKGRSWSVFYLRWFGLAYFLDGVMGAFLGRTFLDLGVFRGIPATDPSIRLLVNVPHIVIGGVAAFLGLWWFPWRDSRASSS